MDSNGTCATILDCKFANMSKEHVDFESLQNRIAIDLVYCPKIIVYKYLYNQTIQ